MDAATPAVDPRALLADCDLIEAFIIDVNGVPRGKWIQRDRVDSLLAGGVGLPRSAYLLDIWGRDIVEGGIAFETGDPDGTCIAVPHSISLMPWVEGCAAQVLLTMREPDGSLFFADPRGVLSRVLDRLAARGFTPSVGIEFEFYLVDPKRGSSLCVAPRGADETFWRGWQSDTLGLSEMNEYEPILRDLLRAADFQSIALDTLISENGPGQFEVTMHHAADALRIADDAVLFKRAIKQIARRHGLAATFMAKPFGAWSGSGMHVHLSLLERGGRNAFAGAAARAAPLLYNAVGGLVAAMPDTMLTFAPHANSYRRFAPGTHAPVFADWGHDNRMSAIRVINTSPAAARIEHRVAGADCNPYLVLASLLGAMLDGIETAADPGPETIGGTPLASAPRLPVAWDQALDSFAASPHVASIFGADFPRVFAACKRQEIAEFRRRVPDVEYEAYLKNA